MKEVSSGGSPSQKVPDTAPENCAEHGRARGHWRLGMSEEAESSGLLLLKAARGEAGCSRSPESRQHQALGPPDQSTEDCWDLRAQPKPATQQAPQHGEGGTGQHHDRITESLRLEKTSEITISNHQPNPTVPAKPCPEMSHPHGFLIPPGMGTPPPHWAAWSYP